MTTRQLDQFLEIYPVETIEKAFTPLTIQLCEDQVNAVKIVATRKVFFTHLSLYLFLPFPYLPEGKDRNPNAISA